MRLRVPGDKSLTQRALILAALGEGESRLSGLLHGGDAASTAGALACLGVPIPEIPSDGSEVVVRGVGLAGLAKSGVRLDLGNSGTGARLLLGALSGSPVAATLDGDRSLRSRPMERVTEPLSMMGADFAFEGEPGRLPLTVRGTRPLRPIDWPSPVASAQVKSALLLAGLTGGAFVLLSEPRQSRDHTERLLNAVGAAVVAHEHEGRWRVELRDPPERIAPLDFAVPGDPSSAAFVAAFAALGGAGGAVTVEGVGLNPTRTAFFDVLRRMGAGVSVEPRAGGGPEPVGDVTVSPGPLRATTVGPDEVPGLIDELPLVAVLAARAEGETRIAGARELRAKESDRIAALVSNLRALGVAVEEAPDGLAVVGSDGPLQGAVRSFGDHRIAMAFSVLGEATGGGVSVDRPDVADVSFPGFGRTIRRLREGEGDR